MNLRARRLWPAALLLLASGLTKESFAAALPFAIGLWWWQERRWSPPLIAFALGVALLAGVNVLTLMAGDYYGSIRTAASVAETAWTMVLAAGPVLLIVLLAIPFDRRLIVGLGIVVVFIMVEAFVYGGLDTAGRYLLPAVIAPLLVVPVALRRLPRKLFAGSVLVLVIATVGATWMQRERAEYWAESSRDFQASLAEIDAHRGPLVITSPFPGFEGAVSVSRYLAGQRPPGACAEVLFGQNPSGVCPSFFYVRGMPTH